MALFSQPAAAADKLACPEIREFSFVCFFLPEDGKWCHDARNLDCFSVVVVVLQNQ
jgi:hypothetical protein